MSEPFSVLHGDMRELVPGMKPESFDSCVTDPPYHLGSIVKRFGKTGAAAPKDRDGLFRRSARGFLGHSWDGGGIAFDPGAWFEVLEVLKPGAFLAAFSHSTLSHRMATAIEDAGFEVYDTIPWIYATGTAMGNLHLGNGIGTRLKRANEPIILARKPLREKTLTAQHAATGTGGLRLQDCRDEDDRWPKNVQVSHSELCGEQCHPDCVMSELRRQGAPGGSFPAFRYQPKPSQLEKCAGLYLLPEVIRRRVNPGGMERDPKWAPIATRNPHATVKPVNLMRWLVRLVTPEGGAVLDPFAGSGTTGVAAILEGLYPTMIEMLPREPGDDDYISVILSRCLHAVEVAEGQELVEVEGTPTMLLNRLRQGVIE